MINIGSINNLLVKRETDSGFYLCEPDGNSEVFLPPAMSDKKIEIDQMLDVFVYVDNKEQLIATTGKPHAVVGEYALMESIDVQEFGAFFDWGIEKDLLVPGNEQNFKVKEGLEYLVRVCLEEGTDRVFGTTKLGKYIQSSVFDINEGEKVSVVSTEETELCFRVIINKKFIGMIYFSEIFKEVKIGFETEGYVKKIREDGLVDCALQIQGIKNLDQSKTVILKYLYANEGKCHLHDKSDPLEIRALFGMSKKTFKNAVGMLYKDKRIVLKDDGIELAPKKR